MPDRRSLESQASDLNYPSPVAAEHIFIQLAGNFPPAAIAWVRRAHWVGPVQVPWSQVDTGDQGKWAASRQPGKVRKFARQIKAHGNHVAPSVAAWEASGGKVFIIDGHHRGLARKKLGMPLLAYVGTIDPGDRRAVLETHTRQVHQGSDPQNKSAQTPVVSTVHHPLGHEGLWGTPSEKVPQLQQLPAYVQNTARALMRTQGMEESRAIATAISAVRAWASGTAFGGKVKVTPEVRQAAQRALAEWEQLRASHH